jgi:ZIP family zinc transporter
MDSTLVIGTALAAGLASPLGGALALLWSPSTLATSIAVGAAGGVLLGAVSFEMMPRALELGGVALAVVGFAAGLAAVYAFDLFVHRGQLAGRKAEERDAVTRYHEAHAARGGEITVLAGATSAEELIEGLSIGVGAAIDPRLGLVVALAIIIDNFTESLSIGSLIRAEGKETGRALWLRMLGWTGLIGVSILVSTLFGWFFLGGLSPKILGPLFAAGAGGMFYLTVSDLIPDAEERQYEQSAALATAAGFLVIFVLSNQW